MRVSPRTHSAVLNTSSRRDLDIHVYTTLTYRSPTLVFADDKRSFPIPGTSARLLGDTYIGEGCDASLLVRDALALLAAQKLTVLGERIKYSMGRIGGDTVAVSAYLLIFYIHFLSSNCCAVSSVGDCIQ